MKIITLIRGGIGNQLFCYAAARRLALANNVELVIDDRSGFTRDFKYQRKYALDNFYIPIRKATKLERLEPFERYRRALLKWSSRRKPFYQRGYLEQDGIDFDERLLALKVKETLYLDGYWQSEGYFKDVEQTIREDLRIIPPTDALNQRMADKIRKSEAVALHVRWFDSPGSMEDHNASAKYYHRAIEFMENSIESPHYFLFSDDPDAARRKFDLPKARVTFVSHNQGDENAYADLWLMTQCKHFITANSTFSWWGAWLSGGMGKVVVTPSKLIGNVTAWGFDGLIPKNWIQLKLKS